MIEIYKASAGSGKTFTLTREYIKFILGYKDERGQYHLNKGKEGGHRNVLAITFTNKATEEMKSRIIHELAVIAGAEPGWEKKSPYLKDLCKEFACSPEELAASAGRALRDLLFDFDRFSVSTIDAFFQTVLRAFAHEADVSGNYDVELDDKVVIAASVDRMLEDLNRFPDSPDSRYLIEWLTRYMIKLIEEGKSFNIFNRSSQVNSQLINFIEDITNDTFKAHSEEILGYLNDRERFIAFIEAMHGRINEMKKMVATKCRIAVDLIESTPGAESIFQSVVINNFRGWAEKGWWKEPGVKLLKAIADINEAYLKKSVNSPLRTTRLDEVVIDALDAIDKAYKDLTFLNIIAGNLYHLGLLQSIMEYVERFRKEKSVILLSDTNSILAKIIGEEESPFLYEKIGNVYRHFLIDEFQDTSHSQWQNIRPLLNESLATDNDNLIIGDEKQCIYRFRNSDPSLLKNLHKDRVAAGRSTVKGNNLSENTNWRSSKEIVQFNNTLFSALSRQLGFKDTYGNVAQQISEKHENHNGYVRVNIYSESKDSDVTGQTLETLTTQLRRQLDSGYKPGEIAILVRRWKEGDTVIAHLEKVRNSDPTFPQFNIVSDKSLLVSRSKSVSFIISNLRFISLTNFSADKRKRSHKEVAKILTEYEAGISRKLTPTEALEAAVARLDSEEFDDQDNAKGFDSMDLTTLVETIISDLPEENRKEENIYLTAFQDLVIDFMSKGRADIRSFLEWWDKDGVKVSVSGAKDDMALNILTVHKSKGLEYRCVHIPFAEFRENNFPDTEWFKLDAIEGIDPAVVPPMIPLNLMASMNKTSLEKEYRQYCLEKQLDRLNLLYVAFTRAVDELIIGLAVPQKFISGEDKKTDTESLTPAKFLYQAMNSCGVDFFESLKAETVLKEDVKVFPFLPFAPDPDGLIEVGKPTIARKLDKEKGSAMTPASTRMMEEFTLTSNSSIWANTRLDKNNFAKTLTARERGLIIHDVLSRVVTTADIDGALNILQILPATIGADDDEKKEISRIVRKRVTDPLVSQWFEGFKRVLIEREVMTATGETKRFDRVVWTADGQIHLIDYKSGFQDPHEYKKQIEGYIDFFRSLGYSEVRGFLYYLDTGEVIEI